MPEIYIKQINCIECRIEVDIIIDCKSDSIITEISPNMEQYITIDRCDAFVMGLMYFAMKNGYDFKSEIPMTEELYYNLDNHFIDAIAHKSSGLYRPILTIPTIKHCEHIDIIVAT